MGKMYKVVVVPGWAGRVWHGSFLGSALVLMMQLSVFGASSVTLAWNASSDTNVLGYNIHYGGASGVYTNTIYAGNATNLTITGLVRGTTYYFAAATYNIVGFESSLSDEVSYQVALTTNQPPTLNALSNLTINENAGLQAVSLSGITSGATNENQTLTVTAVSGNPGVVPHPTVTYTSPATDGTLTFTPLTNANGTVTITVTVNDGGDNSNIVTRAFSVTINPVNNLPTLDAIGNLTTNENAGLQTVNLSGISSGATNENQTLTVTAVSGNTAVIPHPTVSYTNANKTGKLTFTPVNGAYGTATVTVTVNDGGTSNNIVTRNFTVTVNAVNQLPTLDAISNLATNENAGLLTVNLSGISSGAANENQTLTVTAVSGNTNLVPHPTVNYTNASTAGSLTFTPLTNATGSAVISVTVNDGGASNNIFTRTFTVTLNATNLSPTLNPVADIVVNASGRSQKVILTGISAGPTNTGKTIRVTAVSSNMRVASRPVVLYSSPATNGTLTFRPGFSTGTATISVTVNNGASSNNIITRTFKVTVVARNASTNLIASATMPFGGANSGANAAASLQASTLETAACARGEFALKVAGAAGHRYVVEASTDLVNWEPVATNAAPFTFVDADAGRFAQRFYRSVGAP
jgi:hypothetical protein